MPGLTMLKYGYAKCCAEITKDTSSAMSSEENASSAQQGPQQRHATHAQSAQHATSDVTSQLHSQHQRRPRSVPSSQQQPHAPNQNGGHEHNPQGRLIDGRRQNQNGRPRSAKAYTNPHAYNSALESDPKAMTTSHRLRDDMTMSELIDYEDDGGDSLIDSVAEMGEQFDESTARIFIALFDYDPYTMSPNTEGADEELPFKEGQLIKVSELGQFIKVSEMGQFIKVSELCQFIRVSGLGQLIKVSELGHEVRYAFNAMRRP